jgi:ubiquinone/menaquinone biosynthesis C-methylase UbiE
MLLRILEPELMDTQRDAEEYDAMDFTEANTKFAVDALALVADRQDVQVLDVGTGTAQIPVLMLNRRPDLKMLAVDLAQEMLKVAARNVADAGHGGSCQLARMDAKALRLPSGRFDLVLCNSTAHHIPDPLVLFREIARMVKPDGAILVRDLIRPPSMDEAWAIVKRVAAGEHMRQQQLFFDSLCAALTVAEVQQIVRDAGLPRMRVEMVSDRHWSAEQRARPRPSTAPPRG